MGLLIITGNDKKIQTWLVDKDFLGIAKVEQKIVPDESMGPRLREDDAQVIPTSLNDALNVKPYKAPEIRDIQTWINSDPLTLEKLKGKVVLIDFWTYSCINCQRTQLYLNKWYDKYHDKGFEIIGVHAPEFSFEKVPENVRKAIEDEKIKYPVAMDNNFATWRAYDNQYWPAKYLIDANGNVRYTHFGEGDYDMTETAIQQLLDQAGKSVTEKVEDLIAGLGNTRGQTPETYLGYNRGKNFANDIEYQPDADIVYKLSDMLIQNEWTLGGKWFVSSESILNEDDGGKLIFKYSAKEVYLVMDGPIGSKVHVSIGDIAPGGGDVDANGDLTIDGPRLYKLVKTSDFLQMHNLELTFPAGVYANAFTFGG
jgi:thiol-disulfide isomerase/thioredoxin